MEWFLYVSFVFLLIRFTIALLNLIHHPLIPVSRSHSYPLLSILIPARNEASNLPCLFSQLQNIKYDPLEIIVLNDHSEDNSEQILKDYQKKSPKITYINGKELPKGWLGKNWACHQLSQIAQGEYMLFLDADISELHPELCVYTVTEAQKRKLALLSIFPQQYMLTMAERSIVPIMHYLLLSLLPLSWIYKLPFPSMSAANGQYMLFNAQIYRRYLWHKSVKKIIVEDIAIMRKIKKQGLKGMTYLSRGLIKCRMYHSYRDGIEGFSKNILAGFGNSITGLMIYLVLVIFSWPFTIIYLPVCVGLLSILMILGIRIIISYISKEHISWNILLHPVHMTHLIAISFLSVYKKTTKRNIWKGRNVA